MLREISGEERGEKYSDPPEELSAVLKTMVQFWMRPSAWKSNQTAAP
jgi:hypothetical protein